MYAQDSIALLKSAGIDFKRHLDYGIYAEDFGEHIISSGLVLNPVRYHFYHSVRSQAHCLAGCQMDRLPRRI
jgi:CCR4-NOT transcription complex subunit 7/8